MLDIILYFVVLLPIVFSIGAFVRVKRHPILDHQSKSTWYNIYFVLSLLAFIFGLLFAFEYCGRCWDTASGMISLAFNAALYYIASLTATVYGLIIAKKANVVQFYIFIVGTVLIYVPFVIAIARFY